MAIMSTYSSELISVSSIVTYDVYKMYFKPTAPGKDLMRMNYIVMSIFALFMAGFVSRLMLSFLRRQRLTTRNSRRCSTTLAYQWATSTCSWVS
jgi:hypothetical protein